MLKEGDKAPLDLEVNLNEKETVSLKQYLGKYVFLYFYPKDDTPGCTKEACGFRDANNEIEELGAKVVGVSKDGLASHDKFAEKHSLNFTLLSDEDHKLMEAFGVWGERSFMGKTYMGTSRSTFIIDPEGNIVKVWEKVKPANHTEEVLDYLKSIK